MQTIVAAGAPLHTPLGDFIALPRLPGGEGLVAPPKNPTPALGPSGLGVPHPITFLNYTPPVLFF